RAESPDGTWARTTPGESGTPAAAARRAPGRRSRSPAPQARRPSHARRGPSRGGRRTSPSTPQGPWPGSPRSKRRPKADPFGCPQRTLNGTATLLHVLDEPGGREQVQQRIVTTQDCGGDELAAKEPQHVAVP